MTRSLLVSLGGSAYPRAERFRHPAFAPSSSAIASCLMARCALVAPDDHLNIFDSNTSWGEQIVRIREWLRSKPSNSHQNIFFHYVGHGSFRRNGSGYFLSINATDVDVMEDTSATLRGLHQMVLKNVPHLRIFYIIDACYSAGALPDIMDGDPLQFIETKVRSEIEEGSGAVDEEATYGIAALCSSAKDAPSNAAGRYGLTQFSDGLVASLEMGDVEQPSQYISFGRLSRLMRRTLSTHYRDRAVLPILHAPQSAQGGISDFPLFPNPAIEALRTALETVSAQDRVSLVTEAAELANEISAAATQGLSPEPGLEKLLVLGDAALARREPEPLPPPDLAAARQELEGIRREIQTICSPGQRLPFDLGNWLGSVWPRALVTMASRPDPSELVSKAMAALERVRQVFEQDNQRADATLAELAGGKSMLTGQAYLVSEVEAYLDAAARAAPAGDIRLSLSEPLRITKDRLQLMLGELGMNDQRIARLAARREANTRALDWLASLEQSYEQAVAHLRTVLADLTSFGTARDALSGLSDAYSRIAPLITGLIDLVASDGSAPIGTGFLSSDQPAISAAGDGDTLASESEEKDGATPDLGRVAIPPDVELDPAIDLLPSSLSMIEIRDIGLRFYGLPLGKRSEIATKLGLLDDADLRCANVTQRFRFVLHRAHNRGQLDALADAVTKAEG